MDPLPMPGPIPRVSPFDLEAVRAKYRKLADDLEAQLMERMNALDPTAPMMPGASVGDWVMDTYSHGGYVIDEAKALATPCQKVIFSEEEEEGYLVFSPGIQGPLSDSQITAYCLAGMTDSHASAQVTARIKALAIAAPSCSVSTQSQAPDARLGAYYTCLGEELRNQGVDP